MKRVLLTGMSGTGKSSVVRALAARGYKAIDTDDGWCEALPDGRQRWREDAIRSLLAAEDTDVLFVAGCEDNQAQFHPHFDHIILLTAPLETMLQRVATRTTNPYGTSSADRHRIHDDVRTVEPLLRRVADHEIRTTIPLAEVVTTVLRLVGADASPPSSGGHVVRYRAQIAGRVQGVCFRDSCRRRAVEHGVNGWIRNLPDGRVEAVFEGPADAVRRLLDWCRQGPPGAVVQDVQVRREPPAGLAGFSIR